MMGKLLDNLLIGVPVRRVYDPDGLNLYPIEGHEADFDALVRTITAKAGDEYVAFPVPAGPHHYHGLLVVGLEQ